MQKTKKNQRTKESVIDRLETIQPRLRRGDITQIARITGYDPAHVSRVLRGTAVNPSGEIVNQTYQRVKSRKVKA